MIYSEHQRRIAGNPPKRISTLDKILLMHCKADGSFVGKFKPPERWFSRAHLKARRDGLLRAAGPQWSLLGSRPMHMWFLTDKGKAEAERAKARMAQYDEALKAWGERVQEARRLWLEMKA